ncbi:unnamed protein product, partial [Choristocarpus tenellus]
MDAASLFSDKVPPVHMTTSAGEYDTSELPRDASSPFGRNATTLPSTLVPSVTEVQEMPSDLFGADSGAEAFGFSSQNSLPPKYSSPPSVEEMPPDLFGGGNGGGSDAFDRPFGRTPSPPGPYRDNVEQQSLNSQLYPSTGTTRSAFLPNDDIRNPRSGEGATETSGNLSGNAISTSLGAAPPAAFAFDAAPPGRGTGKANGGIPSPAIMPSAQLSSSALSFAPTPSYIPPNRFGNPKHDRSPITTLPPPDNMGEFGSSSGHGFYAGTGVNNMVLESAVAKSSRQDTETESHQPAQMEPQSRLGFNNMSAFNTSTMGLEAKPATEWMPPRAPPSRPPTTQQAEAVFGAPRTSVPGHSVDKVVGGVFNVPSTTEQTQQFYGITSGRTVEDVFGAPPQDMFNRPGEISNNAFGNPPGTKLPSYHPQGVGHGEEGAGATEMASVRVDALQQGQEATVVPMGAPTVKSFASSIAPSAGPVDAWVQGVPRPRFPDGKGVGVPPAGLFSTSGGGNEVVGVATSGPGSAAPSDMFGPSGGGLTLEVDHAADRLGLGVFGAPPAGDFFGTPVQGVGGDVGNAFGSPVNVSDLFKVDHPGAFKAVDVGTPTISVLDQTQQEKLPGSGLSFWASELGSDQGMAGERSSPISPDNVISPGGAASGFEGAETRTVGVDMVDAKAEGVGATNEVGVEIKGGNTTAKVLEFPVTNCGLMETQIQDQWEDNSERESRSHSLASPPSPASPPQEAKPEMTKLPLNTLLPDLPQRSPREKFHFEETEGTPCSRSFSDEYVGSHPDTLEQVRSLAPESILLAQSSLMPTLTLPPAVAVEVPIPASQTSHDFPPAVVETQQIEVPLQGDETLKQSSRSGQALVENIHPESPPRNNGDAHSVMSAPPHAGISEQVVLPEGQSGNCDRLLEEDEPPLGKVMSALQTLESRSGLQEEDSGQELYRVGEGEEDGWVRKWDRKGELSDNELGKEAIADGKTAESGVEIGLRLATGDQGGGEVEMLSGGPVQSLETTQDGNGQRFGYFALQGPDTRAGLGVEAGPERGFGIGQKAKGTGGILRNNGCEQLGMDKGDIQKGVHSNLGIEKQLMDLGDPSQGVPTSFSDEQQHSMDVKEIQGAPVSLGSEPQAKGLKDVQEGVPASFGTEQQAMGLGDVRGGNSELTVPDLETVKVESVQRSGDVKVDDMKGQVCEHEAGEAGGGGTAGNNGVSWHRVAEEDLPGMSDRKSDSSDSESESGSDVTDLSTVETTASDFFMMAPIPSAPFSGSSSVTSSITVSRIASRDSLSGVPITPPSPSSIAAALSKRRCLRERGNQKGPHHGSISPNLHGKSIGDRLMYRLQRGVDARLPPPTVSTMGSITATADASQGKGLTRPRTLRYSPSGPLSIGSGSSPGAVSSGPWGLYRPDSSRVIHPPRRRRPGMTDVGRPVVVDRGGAGIGPSPGSQSEEVKAGEEVDVGLGIDVPSWLKDLEVHGEVEVVAGALEKPSSDLLNNEDPHRVWQQSSAVDNGGEGGLEEMRSFEGVVPSPVVEVKAEVVRLVEEDARRQLRTKGISSSHTLPSVPNTGEEGVGQGDVNVSSENTPEVGDELRPSKEAMVDLRGKQGIDCVNPLSPPPQVPQGGQDQVDSSPSKTSGVSEALEVLPCSVLVEAQPSPLVNKSAPLVRPRNSSGGPFFGFDQYDDTGSTKEDSHGNVSGHQSSDNQADEGPPNRREAEAMFATSAPPPAADSLFSPAAEGDAQENSSDFSSRGFRGNGTGSEGEVRQRPADLFSLGPPPEAPHPSLPNPWGSSPQKAPLIPPPWAQKAGKGFDQPPPCTSWQGGGKFSSDAVPEAFVGEGDGEAGKFGGEGSGDKNAFGGGESSVAGFSRALSSQSIASAVPAVAHVGSTTGLSFAGGSGRGVGGGEPGRISLQSRQRGIATVVSAGTKPAYPSEPGLVGHVSHIQGGAPRYGDQCGGASQSLAGGEIGEGRGRWGVSPGGQSLAIAAPVSAAVAMAGGSVAATRDPRIRPPCALAAFGFAGRLVCMHPRAKVRLASAGAPGQGLPGQADSSFGGGEKQSRLRKGPVKIWSLQSITPPNAFVGDTGVVPGPMIGNTKAALGLVREYVSKRAEGGEDTGEGKRLLWTVVEIALEHEGRLVSDAGTADESSPESKLLRYLKLSHARCRRSFTKLSLDNLTKINNQGLEAAVSEKQLAFPGTKSGASQSSRGKGRGWASSGTARQGPGVGDGGTGVTFRATGQGPFPGPFPGAAAGVPGLSGRGAGFGGSGMSTRAGDSHGVGEGVDGKPGDNGWGARVTQECSASGVGAQAVEEVESLLVDGKKEQAVEAAIRTGLWGLAILISSQCPPPAPSEQGPGDGLGVGQGGVENASVTGQSPVYQRVVRQYADAFLRQGTPLHTMALAFSGQAGTAIKHGGKSLSALGMGGVNRDGGVVGGVNRDAGGKDTNSGDTLVDNWRVTAAAILSNKV